jgi:succinate dehydrogenase / fumarate reductase iron-sulfur subunit
MPSRTVTVQRFNPAVDEKPYHQAYDMELPDHQTILDALLTIADTIDPTLAFRRTCRSGICGACAGTVNGHARLFCQASMGEILGAAMGHDILVAPLPGFRVLRDLVVDMAPFFTELERVNAWLVPDREYSGLMRKDVLQRLWSATRCVLCGVCAAGCGAELAADGPHPAAVARVLRFANDPRDAIGRSRVELLKPVLPGFGFAERLRTICPKQVDITDLIPDCHR